MPTRPAVHSPTPGMVNNRRRASWFEWAAPTPTYYLDSRFELFPADVWDGYAAIAAGGAEAQAALDRWAVDAVVLPAGADPLDGWVSAYDDADGVLLVRAASVGVPALVPPAPPEGPDRSAMVARQGRSDR